MLEEENFYRYNMANSENTSLKLWKMQSATPYSWQPFLTGDLYSPETHCIICNATVNDIQIK